MAERSVARAGRKRTGFLSMTHPREKKSFKENASAFLWGDSLFSAGQNYVASPALPRHIQSVGIIPQTALRIHHGRSSLDINRIGIPFFVSKTFRPGKPWHYHDCRDRQSWL